MGQGERYWLCIWQFIDMLVSIFTAANSCDLLVSLFCPVLVFVQQPQIILLQEGTDTSQGKAQLVSNINASTAVADVVRTTLGPRGMDKLIHDDKGNTTHSSLSQSRNYNFPYQ